MSPKSSMGGQKKSSKKKGGKGRAFPGSSDLATAAGRGPHVPRATIGRDTLLGLAQSQRRTLCYATNATVITGAAGAYAETTFTLNGVFSPSGAGSAAGFAKYMAFYSKAWVMGTRMKASYVNFSVTGPTFVGLTITTNTTSLGNIGAFIENGLGQWHATGVNPDQHDLVVTVETSKFMNKPRVLDDPQFFCTAAANPSQVIVAHMGIVTLAGGAVNSVAAVYEFEFDVVFTDPIPFT